MGTDQTINQIAKRYNLSETEIAILHKSKGVGTSYRRHSELSKEEFDKAIEKLLELNLVIEKDVPSPIKGVEGVTLYIFNKYILINI